MKAGCLGLFLTCVVFYAFSFPMGDFLWSVHLSTPFRRAGEWRRQWFRHMANASRKL
jgi:hypothetical protein